MTSPVPISMVSGSRIVSRSFAGLKAQRALLSARAAALGAPKLTKPPDTLSMLKGMVDMDAFYGTAIVPLWRQGSASVHGHFWTDQMRDNPREFDDLWFHNALYGATMFVNEAMTLHHQRATARP